MSEFQPPSTAKPDTNSNELALPLPAIICIAIGGYILLVVIILFIRSMLLQRGVCSDQCQCCGKEGEPHCCECWIACVEACNCCKNPNLTACLDSFCPRRKQMDCADLILCNVCMDENGQCACCGGPETMCDRLERHCGRCWTFRCRCSVPTYDLCGQPSDCTAPWPFSSCHWPCRTHKPLRVAFCVCPGCSCVCRDHALRLCCSALSCVLTYKLLDCSRLWGYRSPRTHTMRPQWPRFVPSYGQERNSVRSYPQDVHTFTVPVGGVARGVDSNIASVSGSLQNVYAWDIPISHSTYYQYPHAATSPDYFVDHSAMGSPYAAPRSARVPNLAPPKLSPGVTSGGAMLLPESPLPPSVRRHSQQVHYDVGTKTPPAIDISPISSSLSVDFNSQSHRLSAFEEETPVERFVYASPELGRLRHSLRQNAIDHRYIAGPLDDEAVPMVSHRHRSNSGSGQPVSALPPVKNREQRG